MQKLLDSFSHINQYIFWTWHFQHSDSEVELLGCVEDLSATIE